MSAAASIARAPGAQYRVPRDLRWAGIALAVVWFALTALSLADATDPWPLGTTGPFQVGFEPIVAVCVALAAIDRRPLIVAAALLAAPSLAMGSEVLLLWVQNQSSNGALIGVAIETTTLLVLIVGYMAMAVLAFIVVPLRRSLARHVLLTLVALPFLLFAVLWLEDESAALEASLAAASAVWLVTALGYAKPTSASDAEH